MLDIVEKVKQGFFYFTTSMKNRYPCKIEAVDDLYDAQKPSQILYRVLNRLDVRKCTIEELSIDPSIIAKFHPVDAMKLGVLLAGDAMLKNIDHKNISDMKVSYEKLCVSLFQLKE
tara:strand:+ start:1375 stop:1722 length:348 start_codon:yes stop_codon:yes gene_type:complete